MTCERTCASCAFWSNVAPPIATAMRRPAGAAEDVGICGRMPPVIVKHPSGGHSSQFPQVLSSRHCGEWEPITGGTGGGPDDGERVGGSADGSATVTPFRRAA